MAYVLKLLSLKLSIRKATVIYQTVPIHVSEIFIWIPVTYIYLFGTNSKYSCCLHHCIDSVYDSGCLEPFPVNKWFPVTKIIS